MEHFSQLSQKPDTSSRVCFPAATARPWATQSATVRQHLEAPRIQRQGPASVPSPDPDPAVFPDFPALTLQLERNLAANLYANAHHFYQVASLYPDDPARMEETFARYAVGANMLESGFQFLGLGPSVAPWAALTSGLAFKGYTFGTRGELVLDYQLGLGEDVGLEANLNLQADPENLTHIQSVDVGLGVVGHF